ncbi:uncharacterized protein LOC120346062 [Styela clava]
MAYECPIVRFHPNAGIENMAIGSQQQDEPVQDPIYENSLPRVIQMEGNIETGTVAVAESKEIKSSGKRSNIGKTVGFLILMSLLFVCLICITIFLVQATTKLEDSNEEIMILQNITSEQKKEMNSSKQLLDRIQSQAMNNIQRLSQRYETIAKNLADLDDKRVNCQKNLIGLIKNSGEQVAKNISFMQQTIECNKVNTGLVGRINKMEEMIRKMNRTVSDPHRQLKLQGLCPVQYLGHCFWSVVHSSKDINVDEAKRICGVNNGLPANVYNEQHLNDLMADIRRKISADTFIWTGMQVDISTNAVLMRDGTRASYVKWWTGGFPNAGESGLYIHVQTDPSSSRQGMGNDPPTSKFHGVICEK